jgi:hypothetical protein
METIFSPPREVWGDLMSEEKAVLASYRTVLRIKEYAEKHFPNNSELHFYLMCNMYLKMWNICKQ